MSNLENFINDNRSEFDSGLPPAHVWDAIEQRLVKKETEKPAVLVHRWVMAIAASLFFCLAVYWLGHKKENGSVAINPAPASAEVANTPQVNEFAKLILLKQQELKALSKEQPELYKKFSSDIIQLDSSYIALKDQLGVSPNKEMLIAAMIQNLQLQLDVLNQQLNIIKAIKQTKKYSHEKKYQTT